MTAPLQRVLEAARKDAEHSRDAFLTPEHVLAAALREDAYAGLIRAAGADAEGMGVMADGLAAYIGALPRARRGREPVTSFCLRSVITRADAACVCAEKDAVGVADVLVSMYDEARSKSSFLLRRAGVSRLSLLEAVSCAGAERAQAEGGAAAAPADKPRGEGRPFPLASYAEDLTAKARAGGVPPVIGREEETERAIAVLCRRFKNNPLFVGEAGVGKTALAGALARRLAEGRVPPRLAGLSLYSLDMGSLVAGTRYRGDFEKRLKGVVDEVSRAGAGGNILFIDEIHTIMGAGRAEGVLLDAANILKPALTSGALRVAGSTTFEDYRKSIENDSALARRFQAITVPEPTEEEALRILRGVKAGYEAHHGARYTGGALKAAVALSARFLPERRLPDKALDVIDEAGAAAGLRPARGGRRERARITEAQIERAVSRMARVPVKAALEAERDALRGLEAGIKAELFGQDEAASRLALAVKRSRAGFRSPEKTAGAFLFTGPTGVGKTEMARVLSRLLGLALHRFDMSEYRERYTVSRLIGSAPGYADSERDGLLTGAVRREPRAVVLFDEIEKAHPDVYNVLLQVLDYGTLTDARGRKADFRSCFVIFTSNAGARESAETAVGFGAGKKGRSAAAGAVEKTFSPEFRNRLDGVMFFSALSRESAARAARKEIAALAARLRARNITLEVTDEAADAIAEAGYSEESGARNIARIVDETIAAPLVDDALFGALASGGRAAFGVINGKITRTA